MNSPLRLNVVMTNAIQRGGAERLLQYLYRKDDPRLRLRLAFLEDGPMVAEARSHEVDATVFPAPRYRDLPGTLRTVLALRSWIRADRPHLVLGWMKKSHLYCAPAAAGLAREAWFQHENPGQGGIDRAIHALPTRGILCCSDYVREAQRRILTRTPCFTVHPCQDVESEPPAEIPWPVPPNAKTLLMVCRLQGWKGPHLAVEALARIRPENGPELHLVVVGGEHDLEPDYPARLRRRIAELAMEDRVHLVGYQKAPASWMRRADVVVHAADHEPFGMVVAEAIASGIPVVASRPGGPQEIVRPGEGLLWDHPNIDSLCSAIVSALELPRTTPRPDRFSVGRYIDDLARSIQYIATSRSSQNDGRGSDQS